MLHSNTTSKRKAPDEPNANADGVMNTNSKTATSNPLINAAKKVKRESKNGASNKRKLANAEEAPGGLFIVRTQLTPSLSLPTPTAASATAKPPAKKFKSFQPPLSHSQPLLSTSTKPPPASRSSLMPPTQPSLLTRYNTPDADPALDAAVRAMDTEAADLRRLSRAPQTPNASSSSHSTNYRVSAQSVSRPTSNGSGQGTRRGTERFIDVSAPLRTEEDETPQIQRNKRLRAGAMAATSSEDSGMDMAVDPVTPPRKPGQSVPGSTRRKSSVGRGKRISTSFEATGIITQPHSSVADTMFYKHIDSDLPDSERIRQLLIWCSARVASNASSSSPSSSSSSSSLPKLSTAAEAALRAIQEDIVRKLAERRVDLFKEPGDANADSATNANVMLAENKQNVTNRTWEGVYSRDIRSAEEEEEGWKKVSSAYEASARRIRSAIEKRRADLGIPAPSAPSNSAPTSVPSSESNSGVGTSSASAKAQGKQRAPSLELREEDLLPSSRAGYRLVRKLLARSRRRKDVGPEHLVETPGAGPSTSTGKGMDPDSRLLPTSSQRYGVDIDVEIEEDAERKEAEAEEAAEKIFRQRMGEAEFKLDMLHVMANQARQTTEVAQMALDMRFGVLARALDARRSGVGTSASAAAAGKTPANVFGRHLEAGAGGRVGGGMKDREEADEALALLRALARVDAARPPAQVGDAARRAVREAQRAGDASERKITEVPVGSGGGLTPRKMPGTPRRGTTPGR